MSQRSSFGSRTSFLSNASGSEFNTITSGRVDDGALMTSLSVLGSWPLFSSVVVVEVELPSAAPPPVLLTGVRPVPGTLALRLDLDADIVSAREEEHN